MHDASAETFDADDGTLAYAKAAGIFIEGIEASADADNVVPPPAPGGLMLLAFGQSNAANTGEGCYRAGDAVSVFNIFDGRYYRAVDPLPGASNDGAAVWGRLADRLVEEGVCRSVILVPIAVGGSFLRDWAPGGPYHRRLVFALHRLRRAGSVPDILCWHQGEAEANLTEMTSGEYQALFMAMLKRVRAAGIAAPVYVAAATFCANGEHPFRNHQAIRAAQRRLIDLSAGICPGPDTDTLRDANRFDGCHFSAAGLDRHAALWLAALKRGYVAMVARSVWYRIALDDGRSGKGMLARAKHAVLRTVEGLGYVVLKRSDHAALLGASVAPPAPVAVPSPPPPPTEPDAPALGSSNVTVPGPRPGALALQSLCRQIVESGVRGAFVEIGNGETAGLALIAEALRGLGVDDRDLFLFDTSGDPTHRAVRTLPLWGGDGGGLRLLEVPPPSALAREEAAELPAELRATGYPAERIRIVRGIGSAATRAVAPQQIAYLAAGCDPHEANRIALRELLPRLVNGGVLAERQAGPPGRRNALAEECATALGEVFLHPVDEGFRLGSVSRLAAAQSSAT